MSFLSTINNLLRCEDMKRKGNLVLVRHGESRWNVLGLFTGWIDVPLSDKGIDEARQTAKHCEQFDYNAAFTSNLGRARETLLIILAKQKRVGFFQHKNKSNYHQIHSSPEIAKEMFPIIIDERLNERAYGDLQGMVKDVANKEYGEKQVLEWRRGFKDRPPGGESLQDVYSRTIPYFQKVIQSRVMAGETILIAGHGNTLRAIIKFLEMIPDSKIPFIELPTGTPIVYEWHHDTFKRIDGKYSFRRPLR